MIRNKWLTVGLALTIGLAAGCNNKPASSTPVNPGGTAGPPKGGETKTNVGKGGLENPPPP